MKQITHITLLFILMPVLLWAQKTVTGTINDSNGMPLPGASVLVEGTTNGAVTDFEGQYTINVETDDATLVVSYVGFETQYINVGSKTQVDVTLEEASEMLDQVVLIGYGAVEREDLTGSVTTVKPKEDAVAQNQSVEQLLQGKAPGVVVSANGFEPGAPSSVRIRGLNSLTSNTEPLYVIDGVIVDSATEDTSDPLSGGNSYMAPQGGLTGINPRDIESVEILKDASATAIYGSRGANGVIIITTKSGQKGEAKINYTTTTRVGTITNNIEVLKTNDYIDYVNESRANRGFNPTFYQYSNGSIALFTNSEEYMVQNADTITRLPAVDWSKDTYQTAVTTTHRLAVSGGGETSDYYIAGGYVSSTGLIPNTYSKSADFNTKLNFDLNDKLQLNLKVAAEHAKNSASKGTENLGSTNNSLVRQIISGAPLLDFNEDDNATAELEETVDGPRAWITDYDDLSSETRLLGALSLQYEISDVFDYKLQLGGDYRTKERKIWYGVGLRRGEQSNGEAGLATLDRFRYNIDNTLMFKKRFSKDHRINGTIGAVLDKRDSQRQSNQASNFANKDLRADGIAFGSVQQPVFFDKQGETIVSFLGRLNYTLMNKYLFTGTFRADGSSKFAPGKQWGYFPAFGFAWKLQNEKFLRKSEFVSNLKLRLGWGLTGNQGIPNYQTIVPFLDTETPYSDDQGGALVGIVPTGLANPDLTWETTSQYNAGIDFGFKDDRFTGTIDVYHKHIYDLLLNVTLPGSSAFPTYYANQGELYNKGIEIGFSADVIEGKDFQWNLYGNIAFNRNKVGELGIQPSTFGTATYSAFLGNQVSGGNFFKVPANIFIEGEAPGLFYGFETNGIISSLTELAQAPQFRGNDAQLGDVFLVDQNGDGNITDQDLTIIGDPNPIFNYGFGSGFTYKQFSLNFFFNGVYGNEIANGNFLREGYADNSANNIRQEAYFDAWRETNADGAYPRVGYDIAADTGFTDRIVEDGSFLRLNYVTLGYQIPVGEQSVFDSAYLSISGQNLLLFTNYSGFDPEVNSFSFDPGRVGLDYNSFPNQKSYSVSLNVTF